MSAVVHASAPSLHGLDRGRSAGGWWAVHAYADDDATLFRVLDGVAPLAARARRWFYVRYAEGGLHARVRLRGEREAIAPLIDAIAAAALAAGATRVRGERYVREVDRYGGPDAIGAAEEVFARSTAVARWMLGLPGGDRATARIGCAGALAAVGLTVAAGTREAAGRLSARHAAALARLLSEDAGREVPATPSPPFAAVASIWWSCAARWLTAQAAPEPIDAYRAAIAAHLARLPASRRPEVVGSQIHMTCNRLGVSIVDELQVLGALGAPGSAGDDHGDR